MPYCFMGAAGILSAKILLTRRYLALFPARR